jgi:hypothetical protein
MRGLIGLMVFAVWVPPALSAGPYAIVKIADTTTPSPGGNFGNFTSFGIPAENRNLALGPEGPIVAFSAQGFDGRQGVYIGSLPFSLRGPVNFLTVADTSMQMPGFAGVNFTGFSNLSFGGNALAFVGSGPNPVTDRAVYVQYQSATPQLAVKVGAPSPAGENFQGFTGLSVAGFPAASPAVVFTDPGSAPDQAALILHTSAGNSLILSGSTSAPHITRAFSNQFPGTTSRIAYGIKALGVVTSLFLKQDDATIKVADVLTSIPGGVGRFTSFGDPSVGTQLMVFRGLGAEGQQGIYRKYDALPLEKVIDLSSPAPAGASFTNFSDPATHPAGPAAFVATQDNGIRALYIDTTRVLDTTELLDGKALSSISISRDAVGGSTSIDVAFKATFIDGSEGIYAVAVPEPANAMFASAIALLVRRPWRARNT